MPATHFQNIIYVVGKDVAFDTRRTSCRIRKTCRSRLRLTIVTVPNALCQCNRQDQSHKHRNRAALRKIVVPCSVYLTKQPV